MNVGKVIQRQTLTFLSSRYSVLLIFVGVVVIIVSAFQFGETMMEWSRDQYSQLFNIYHDNIAGEAFQNRMCLPMPIDAVYTWVNGSDPQLIEDLMKYKHTFETSDDTNRSDSDLCKLDHCVAYNHVVIDGFLHRNISLGSLRDLYPEYTGALSMFNLSGKVGADISPDMPASEQRVTLVEFKTLEEVGRAVDLHPVIQVGRKNLTVSRGFLTTDKSHQKLLKLSNVVMVTGLGKEATEDEVRTKVPEAQREFVTKIDLRIPSSLAILTIAKEGDVHTVITEGVKANAESDVKFSSAYLVWNLELEFDGDMSPNRFEDNEALRYSLRSLEKHAPWIRHVFIVTNGQIPSWINLDSPRLSLVSHSEIFANQSHLPTFSSPAIESHMHRTPGLSDKFIYLNDDTMFGKDVWPDDFYTHAGGQKVYLTWPVPNCAEGCPSSWILDNYCDKACNTSECDWDGGDCKGVDAAGPAAAAGGGDPNMDTLYCSNGCANSWVADKYCDTACNNLECGYDAGDCGTANFHRVHSEKIIGPANITLPKGLQVAFFNVTPIFGKKGSIAEGHYQPNDVVRTATVAQLFKTVHLLLHKNVTYTTVELRISGKNEAGEPAEVTFHVNVDTRPVKETAVGLPQQDIVGGNQTQREVTEAPYDFPDVPLEERKPLIGDVIQEKTDVLVPEIAEELLDEETKAKLAALDKMLGDGDLTERGYRQEKAQLLNGYMRSGAFDKQRNLAAAAAAAKPVQGVNDIQRAPSFDKEQAGLPAEQQRLQDFANKQAEQRQRLEREVNDGQQVFADINAVIVDGNQVEAGQGQNRVQQGLKLVDQGNQGLNQVYQGMDPAAQGLDEGAIGRGQNVIGQREFIQGQPLQVDQSKLRQEPAALQAGHQVVGHDQVQLQVGQQAAGPDPVVSQNQQAILQQNMAGQQAANPELLQPQAVVEQQFAQQDQVAQQIVPQQEGQLKFDARQEVPAQGGNPPPVLVADGGAQDQAQIRGQGDIGVGQGGHIQLPGVPDFNFQDMDRKVKNKMGQLRVGEGGVPVGVMGAGMGVGEAGVEGVDSPLRVEQGGVKEDGHKQKIKHPGVPGVDFKKMHQEIDAKIDGFRRKVVGPDGGPQRKVEGGGLSPEEMQVEAGARGKLQEEGNAGVDGVIKKDLGEEGDGQHLEKGEIDVLLDKNRRRLLSLSDVREEETLAAAETSRRSVPSESERAGTEHSQEWNIPKLAKGPMLAMKISDGKKITKEEKMKSVGMRSAWREPEAGSYIPDKEVESKQNVAGLETLAARGSRDRLGATVDRDEVLRVNEKYSRENSFLPWERTNHYTNHSEVKQESRLNDYAVLKHRSRKLLDTYGSSLKHVNKLYNKHFGFVARKVPAHMVHMIDVNIMNDLQAEFPEEFDLTSSHRIRHGQDMQFSFSFMYYMMSTPKEVNASEVFAEFDTDKSGILSDREIRTLATRLYDLPLDLQTLSGLEQMIINCSKFFRDPTEIDPEILEEYYVKEMPQVTRALILDCGPVIKKMQASVEGQTKYKYEFMGEEEIAFKMIRTNVSHVIGQLDDVRKNPKKFVCLNDNINHNAEGAKMVKAVLLDFYEAMFPIPSQFELPREYRNRFLHIDELRGWRSYRDWLRFWTHISLAALVLFSIATFCSNQLVGCKRRCCGRRGRRVCGDISERVFHV